MKLNQFIVLLCCVLPFFSCTSVPISRDRLAEIVVEMSLVDQMIQEQHQMNRTSDTSLVYAAVLQKYGYSVNDFDRSLTHHLQRPEKLNRRLISYRDLLLKERDALRKDIDNEIHTIPVDSTIVRHIDSLMRNWLIDSVDVGPWVLLPVPDSVPVKPRYHVFYPFS